jgi:hypothetical protein
MSEAVLNEIAIEIYIALVQQRDPSFDREDLGSGYDIFKAAVHDGGAWEALKVAKRVYAIVEEDANGEP